jgi:hypothetical protein
VVKRPRRSVAVHRRPAYDVVHGGVKKRRKTSGPPVEWNFTGFHGYRAIIEVK